MSISRKPGQCVPPCSACRPSAGLCGSLWPGVGKALLREPGPGCWREALFIYCRQIDSVWWQQAPPREMGNTVLGQPSDAGTYIGQCVCYRRPPQGGWEGGGAFAACPAHVDPGEAASVIHSRRKSNPLTFGVAKLGVSFVDKKKTQ